MDEGRKRVIAIMAGILSSLHMDTVPPQLEMEKAFFR